MSVNPMNHCDRCQDLGEPCCPEHDPTIDMGWDEQTDRRGTRAERRYERQIYGD